MMCHCVWFPPARLPRFTLSDNTVTTSQISKFNGQHDKAMLTNSHTAYHLAPLA